MASQQRFEDLTRSTFQTLEPQLAQLAALDEEILETQIALSRIPAPTGLEQKRAAWISARLRGYGLDTRTDEAGNVIARAPHLRSTRSPVVVAAHLDTVFPMDAVLDFTREGDRVTGPGVSDNGRGLTAMLALARVMPRDSHRWTRPVEFVATTGEEGAGDLRGMKHYVKNAARPFALIALDGAGDDRVVNIALGSRRFRVEFAGPGGHSWSAFGTVNPVHAAARAAANLASLKLPDAGGSTLTVSRIGGGLSVNAIPGDAWFEVDVRSMSESSLSRIESDVMDIARAAAGEENQRSTSGTRLALRVNRIGARPAGETSADSALVLSAMESTRLVDREPGIAAASTDANAGMVAGIPSIAIGGGGRGGDAHTLHEWYENDGASAGLQRAMTIVATMARIAAD